MRPFIGVDTLYICFAFASKIINAHGCTEQNKHFKFMKKKKYTDFLRIKYKFVILHDIPDSLRSELYCVQRTESVPFVIID